VQPPSLHPVSRDGSSLHPLFPHYVKEQRLALRFRVYQSPSALFKVRSWL
jgi:hypothetical protein